jgi:hypothetical protein
MVFLGQDHHHIKGEREENDRGMMYKQMEEGRTVSKRSGVLHLKLMMSVDKAMDWVFVSVKSEKSGASDTRFTFISHPRG